MIFRSGEERKISIQWKFSFLLQKSQTKLSHSQKNRKDLAGCWRHSDSIRAVLIDQVSSDWETTWWRVVQAFGSLSVQVFIIYSYIDLIGSHQNHQGNPITSRYYQSSNSSKQLDIIIIHSYLVIVVIVVASQTPYKSSAIAHLINPQSIITTSSLVDSSRSCDLGKTGILQSLSVYLEISSF